MKSVARYVVTFGIASGFLFFAARILNSHPHSPTPSQLLSHLLASAPIILVHSLSLLKLRTPQSRIPLWLLILLNVLMTCLFLAGIVYLHSTGCGPLKLITFFVLWLFPFLVGAAYFLGLAWSSYRRAWSAANQRLERP